MLWAAVAACCAWAVGRAFGLERGYPLVPLVAFTPYAAAAAVLVAPLAAVLRERAAALVAGVAALVLVAAVAPRAVGDGGARDGRSLRVMSVNLHRGQASPEQVVALARRWDADVLSLQEVDAQAVAALESAGLRGALAERVLALGRGDHGTALYAREPLRRGRGPAGTWNAQAVAIAGGIEFTAVHPPAPATALRARAWRRDLAKLPAAGGRLRILAGDFNATLDHASLRRLLATGYRDAAAAAGRGLRPTWPVGRRLPPPVTIDHVLVDERIAVRRVELREVAGSDHRALLAHVVLPQ